MAKKFIDLDEIMAQFPGHVYWLDSNNVYQGCNNLQAKTFGLSSKLEIVGKTNNQLLDPDIAKICNKNNLEVLETGVAKVFEEPIVWKDGSKGVVLSHKEPLYDKGGNIIGLIGTSIDFTKRKEKEDELKKKLKEVGPALEYILSHMPGHVYWKDTHGVYMGCNDLQAISLGYKYGYEIIGKTDFELTSDKKLAAAFCENDSRIMNSGVPETVEEEIYIKGKKALVLSSKAPLKNKNGDILGIIGISFDITERKKMEEDLKKAKIAAEASDRAKTEFLENMRHDIRTPLSGIVGFSELLAGEIDNTKIKEYTGYLNKASKVLLNFLNEVLESINVASGEIPLLKKKFDLRETLENIIKLHSPTALQKKIELTFGVDKNIPKYLIGDPVRIYRIVLELVGNALKFTQKGHVRIIANIGNKTERDIVIQIFVEDTGIGIPPDREEDLFIRFKRLTPSYQGIYKGIGLGLSIVKQFIDDLQGEIYVESHLGEGSKFVCIIPLKEPLLEENPFNNLTSSMDLSCL